MSTEKFHGLQFLENMTKFKNEGPTADLLAQHYHLVAEAFEYFLQCLSVSRGLQEDATSNHCPDETRILTHVVEDKVRERSENWHNHLRDCCACKHTYDTYTFLVDNLSKVLRQESQIFVASIILAYLRGDDPALIQNIFDALEGHDESLEINMTEDPFFLKGILVVLRADPLTKKGVEQVHFGLVRREFHVMGSTICRTLPLDGSLFFRTDLSNELDEFYFWLWNDAIKTAEGLRFHFNVNPPEGELLEAFPTGEFVQTAKGASVQDKEKKYPEFEAIFFGVIENSSERFIHPKKEF